MPPLQPALVQLPEVVDFDASFSGVTRQWLDPASWVDLRPGWVTGSDQLFAEVLEVREWGERTRPMYGETAGVPRGVELILERMAGCLSARYGVPFDSVSVNHYRDGADSVPWHRDRMSRGVPHPVVAIVSLGEPRVLSLRRVGGVTERSFPLGRGDLLVTGGLAQVNWEHAVPRASRAVGQRVSCAFRHGPRPAPRSALPPSPWPG